MARPNSRNRIDVMAREAEQALIARREAVLLNELALDQAATVRRSDIDAAVNLWAQANAGTEIARLFDGPGREDERV
jgi:hypothetical protein